MKPTKLYTKEELEFYGDFSPDGQIETILSAQAVLAPLGMKFDPCWDPEPGFGFTNISPPDSTSLSWAISP